MSETSVRCRGLGCLLRESCEHYRPGYGPAKGETFRIEEYSPSHGCPNHVLKKSEPVIGEYVNANRKY
jgi:hypothetical protein